MVRAWQYLRRWSLYWKAWRRWRGPGFLVPAPFPLRLQTGTDLKAARWGLLAWEDPEEFVAGSPFWTVAPTLEAAVSSRSTPLIPRLEELGASLSGLHLADGGLILKVELGCAAAQLRIASGAVPGPQDGVVGEHDILQEPSGFIARLENACALAAGDVPPGGRGRGTKTRNFSRRWTHSTRARSRRRSRPICSAPTRSRRTGTTTAGCGRRRAGG